MTHVRLSATEQPVRYCDRCETEQGKGIVDAGDHACSACGAHRAPHIYVPTDAAAIERVARRLYQRGHGYDIDADETARWSMLSLAADLLRAAGDLT